MQTRGRGSSSAKFGCLFLIATSWREARRQRPRGRSNMNKIVCAFCALIGIASGVCAQTDGGESELLKTIQSFNLTGTSATAAAASPAKNTTEKRKDDDERKGPTEITAAKEANFD